MADVYGAIDEKTGLGVALKILRLAVARDTELMQRFQREARVHEMVAHRNVAKMYNGGFTERREPYLVMELLRGRSLRNLLARRVQVDVIRSASYCWQALQGLAAVHMVGVMHRDLKPANMMLEPSNGPVERVVLIDFGFASLEGGARLTQSGHVVGSLSYLAPERLRGEPGDERSDLYAIGVVMFELLTGDPPFTAEDDFDLINQHLDQDATFPPERSQRIPLALQDVILRSLAKHPDDRPPNAARMADELEEALADYEP